MVSLSSLSDSRPIIVSRGSPSNEQNFHNQYLKVFEDENLKISDKEAALRLIINDYAMKLFAEESNEMAAQVFEFLQSNFLSSYNYVKEPCPFPGIERSVNL